MAKPYHAVPSPGMSINGDRGGAWRNPIDDLAVCEDGIGHARETMNEVIAGYVSNKKPR